MRRQLQILLALACSVGLTLPAAMSLPHGQDEKPAAQAAEVLEEGKFVLHKFEQPIGEETYQITAEGDSLAAKIDFKFTDRGTEVPLSATFHAASPLPPKAKSHLESAYCRILGSCQSQEL